MRILFVDHESTLGGAELSMVDIIKNSSSQEVEFSAIIRSGGELECALKDAGANKIYFQPTDSWRWWESGIISRLKLILSIPKQLYNAYAFFKLFKKIKPDIIHFNLTRIIEPLIAGYFSRIPTIMHFREDPEHNKNFFGGDFLLFKFLNLADHWVANSQTTYRYIVENNESKDSAVILNGIDINKFYPIENQKLPSFTVLMLAGIVPWKNHMLFLEIAKEVVKTNSKINFIIAGKGDSSYEASLKKIVIEWDLQNHVKFIGFVEDTPTLLNSIHLLLHTSGKETFGRVFVEAMACKIPVVAIKGGSADEIIENGISGYTFEKSEISAIANQIVELSTNNEIYNRIADASRNRAVEEYSLERLSSNILKLYKTTITGKK